MCVRTVAMRCLRVRLCDRVRKVRMGVGALVRMGGAWSACTASCVSCTRFAANLALAPMLNDDDNALGRRTPELDRTFASWGWVALPVGG